MNARELKVSEHLVRRTARRQERHLQQLVDHAEQMRRAGMVAEANQARAQLAVVEGIPLWARGVRVEGHRFGFRWRVVATA